VRHGQPKTARIFSGVVVLAWNTLRRKRTSRLALLPSRISWLHNLAGVVKAPASLYNNAMEENKTIVELRTKLEVRTWFLRASLGVNVALLCGIVVQLLMRR
jgi:hypothetical protein